MKGESSVSEVLITAISLLFLVMGVVLLITVILTKINPYEQIAFANVERLRATMDEVCFTGAEKTMSFDLPQLSPQFQSVLPIMPLWIIQTNGDPNYVLYYESYPAGDATGWETYHSMQNRMITPYVGSDGSSSAKRYAESMLSTWNSKVVSNSQIDDEQFKSRKLEGIVLNNIVLNKNPDFYAHEDISQTNNQENTDSSLGTWKSVIDQSLENPVPVEGDNVFLFSNYASLTSFEKTSIKYAPCGDNSLCLKTRSGVYKFPLRQCNDIKYVELVYDSRDKRRYIYEAAGVALIAVAAAPIILPSGGALAVGSAAPAGATVIGETAFGEALLMSGGVTFTAAPSASGLVVTEIVGATGAGAGVTLTSTVGWLGRGLLKISKFSIGKTWRFVKGGIGFVWKWCNICAIGGTLYSGEKIGEFLGGVFLSSKVQDFNIASDCSLKDAVIRKIPCSQIKCADIDSYPIYQYGSDGNLHASGEHYTCIEKIGADIDEPSGSGIRGNDNCLQVIVTKRAEGFCWTPDPFRKNWIINDPGGFDTRGIAYVIGMMPINENTAYISDGKAVVMKYITPLDLQGWKDYFQQQLTWAWPG